MNRQNSVRKLIIVDIKIELISKRRAKSKLKQKLNLQLVQF